MAAVDFFSSFGYKWGQDGSTYNWDDAQYKQGWATIGSVPPSVEQFNRIHQIADEKANYLFAHLQQAVLDAGLTLTPSGTDSLAKAIRALSLPVYETVPSSNVGPIIYVLQRQSILQWMTIGSWTGYASPRVGEVEFGWTPSPLPWQIDATGGVFSKTEYASLYARFQASGLLVPSASWVAGEYKICDVSSTEFRAPDLRDMFLRFTGTDADTANARELGSEQPDAIQHLEGSFGGASDGLEAGIVYAVSGVFASSETGLPAMVYSTVNPSVMRNRHVLFDASRVARTAVETRSLNTAFSPRIYR